MTSEQSPPAPIEPTPAHPSGEGSARRQVRHTARGLHLMLASAIVLGVFLQVYLIGSYIFGAGETALHAHESIGFGVQGLEVLVFMAALVAWLPRADLVRSLVLAIVGSVQAGLASADRWVGGLHPLLALVVLALASNLVVRALSQWRIARQGGVG